MTVKSEMTVSELKTKVFDEILKDKPDFEITDVSQIRIRNPKNDDLGDVLSNDEMTLDTLFLYDGKELLIQKKESAEVDASDKYYILVREWHPETWTFGPLYEVAIDKLLSCDKLAKYLQMNYFPHIQLNSLFG
jgi:hypothetical protein